MYATQQLRDEHEGIQMILSVLEHLAGELIAGHAVNLDHLEQILDFLRTFADKCHHGKEEELLFPALKATGMPWEGGPIAVMLAEHDQGRGYIRGMGEALEKMRAGEAAGQSFAKNALGYVALLRQHIDKEGNILFTMAEHLIPAARHETLAFEFAQLENERVGAGVHERYHQLIHTLRDAYLKTAA